MVRDLSHPWKTDKVFENIMLAETLPAWTERDRDGSIGRKNDFEGGALDTEACRHRPSLVRPLIPGPRAKSCLLRLK